MNLPTKYIAIDIETTDADHRLGDVIQIGAVVVNEDLSMGSTFSTYLKPESSFRNPEAMAVNKITEETLESAPTSDRALANFETFCKFQAGDRPMLAAWGTYFDVTFLREFYHHIGRKWPFSYRCLDLKTIAIWEASKRGESAEGGVSKHLELLGLEFEGEQHDALADIKNTMRIVQAYGCDKPSSSSA
jgi:DNA polymerase III epsilon subunit-like protein